MELPSGPFGRSPSPPGTITPVPIDANTPVSGPVEYGLPPIHGLPAASAPRPLQKPATAQPGLDPKALAREQARLGDELYRRARFAEAFKFFQEAVRLDPSEGACHFRFAMCAWQTRRLEHVGRHLHEAARLAPANAAVQEALGQWYFEEGDVAMALPHSARALELAPADPLVAISHAFVLEGNGEPEAAWRVIEPLTALPRKPSRLGIIYARVAPAVKREAEAVRVIDGLLASRDTTPPEKPPLHLAAAKLLDRMGRFDDAFGHARTGKQLSRMPYDATLNAENVDRRIRYFNPAKLHDLPRASHRSRRPVFIVGMPRSGTSLVEQILASHPQVYGAGELPTLSRVANAAARADWSDGQIYPEYMDSISVRRANQLAGEYLAALEAMNATATYVTDKMPMNFMYLGLIQLLFPDCHVIHCVRDPRDTCLSCYMTYFANGHEFSHDLGHLGAFYLDYERVMNHWKTTVNFPMVEVRYEDVVADLEGQTRRLLEFLDLPWDDRCARFHESGRAVGTASSDQVRRPLYGSSVGRWKHYERHLGPLLDGLRSFDLIDGRQ